MKQIKLTEDKIPLQDGQFPWVWQTTTKGLSYLPSTYPPVEISKNCENLSFMCFDIKLFSDLFQLVVFLEFLR